MLINVPRLKQQLNTSENLTDALARKGANLFNQVSFVYREYQRETREEKRLLPCGGRSDS